MLASDRQNDGDVLAMNGVGRGAGHLAAAVSRARSARCRVGPHRRRVRPLPHARRAGRERPRPDRLRHRRRGADDRRLRPRDARRPTWSRRSVRGPPASSARLCDLQQRAGRQGRRRRSRTYVAAAGRRPVRPAARAASTTSFKAAKQTERQAGPGRRGRSRSRTQALGRVDSRSDGRGRHRRRRVLAPPGTTWKSTSSAT